MPEGTYTFYKSVQFLALTEKQKLFVKAYIHEKPWVECILATGTKTHPNHTPSLRNQYNAMFNRSSVVLALLYWFRDKEPSDRFKVSMWTAAQNPDLTRKLRFAAARYQHMMEVVRKTFRVIASKETPKPKLEEKPEEAFSLGDFESRRDNYRFSY